jgi:uncharacterized protein YbjQ (UPF0145 family)
MTKPIEMPFCRVCGSELPPDVSFCPKCGATVKATTAGASTIPFLVVTTPSVQGYRITRVLGVVSGLTPRTRGVLGKFIGGLQTIVGGEITAFTSEIEKARLEAIDRMTAQARAMGANAVVGLDMETSDLLEGVIVIAATGTAVVVEPEGR